MLMVSTFIGPGAIFLIIAGAFNTVFKLDIWTAIMGNGVPVILFMIACYFFDSKYQAANILKLDDGGIGIEACLLNKRMAGCYFHYIFSFILDRTTTFRFSFLS